MDDYRMYSNEYRQHQRERRRRIAVRQRLAFATILIILITFIVGFLTVAAEAKKFEERHPVKLYIVKPTEAEIQPTEATESVLYDVPLDADLQKHIINLCEDYGVDPTIAFAVMWQESRYDAKAIGDNGNSFGLMQIQERWHKGRMERLGCDDLLDPYQNAAVGIDFIAELISEYDGNAEMALMAYNAGSAGAYEYWFQHGIYSNDYSSAVMTEAARLVKSDG